MKLPPYLIIALVIAGALVLWSQFFVDSEEEFPVVRRNEPKSVVKKPPLPPENIAVDDEIVDLFPRPAVPKKEVIEELPPLEEPKLEEMVPQFPLDVLGAWWSEGHRILILSDGTKNYLVCKHCQDHTHLKEGDLITPDWKLIKIEDDALSVEWQPKHIVKHVDLADLKSEPTKTVTK